MNSSFRNLVPFTLIYLKCENKVLLINKASGRSHEGQWIGLGGKIEFGEDPISSAVREFREESGLTLMDPKLRGNLVWISEFFLGVIHIVSGTRYTGRLEESEEGVLLWHQIGDLPSLKRFAPHQHWFLHRILTDEDYFYSGAAVYENGELVHYMDSDHHLDEEECPFIKR